jgi:F0F1-type ATP synthase beta subunit
LFFIAKNCDKKYLKKRKFNGYEYEGYDFSKIIEKIYYLTVQKKKIILEFLTKELERTVHISERIKSENALVGQIKQLNKRGIYIKRQKLVETVEEFIQDGNCLLCGGPGDGKSFLIEEIYRNIWTKKGVCCIIRVNELLKGNDEEIGQELRIGNDWIEGLISIPIQKSKIKNVLFFDAFDTAKDESLKSEVLWQIKKAIEKLKDNWSVVVSLQNI